MTNKFPNWNTENSSTKKIDHFFEWYGQKTRTRLEKEYDRNADVAWHSFPYTGGLAWLRNIGTSGFVKKLMDGVPNGDLWKRALLLRGTVGWIALTILLWVWHSISNKYWHNMPFKKPETSTVIKK